MQEKDKQRNIREWSLTQWWREKEWNISDRQKMLTSAKNQTPTSTGTAADLFYPNFCSLVKLSESLFSETYAICVSFKILTLVVDGVCG